METFEKIIERHHHLIRIAIRKLKIYKNFDHFEQVGLIALWEASKKFCGAKERFAPYAYTMIRYALLMELRAEGTYEDRTLPTEDFIKYEKETIPMNEWEQRQQVHEILAPLKVEEQKLMIALYIKNTRYEDLSKELNVPIETLKKRRQRILKKLRNHFAVGK